MSAKNKARICEFLDRVLTGGDIEATGDYFERDMVEEVPFPGQGPGLDGLKETLIRIQSAFPDSNPVRGRRHAPRVTNRWPVAAEIPLTLRRFGGP